MLAPEFRTLCAVLLAGYLSVHGLRKSSLNYSGAVAAFLVGFCSFVSSYRFGIILIVFYYTSSKLTKVDESRKSKLEAHYQSGGQRNYIQVFANSLAATIIAVVYMYFVGDDDHVTCEYSESSNTISVLGYSLFRKQLAFYLWCMYLAHYSCATADTWASELGVLAKYPPRLVTTFFIQTVPPGTNGGMSIVGTLASAAGGIFIGLTFYALSLFGGAEDVPPETSQFPMVYLGCICGVLGSLFDSILGGSLQATYYSKERKCIVKKSDPDFQKDDSIRCICGIDVLSNEQVNAVSILLTMVASVFFGKMIFCT